MKSMTLRLYPILSALNSPGPRRIRMPESVAPLLHKLRSLLGAHTLPRLQSSTSVTPSFENTESTISQE